MLFIIITFLFLVHFLEKSYRGRIETNTLQYQYCLYALRDELREYVIKGEVNKDDWVFDYLDSSITKTISYLQSISIYKICVVYLIYRGDAKFRQARKHLERELNKPEKTPLKQVDDKLFIILTKYLISRHMGLGLLSHLAIIPIAFIKSVVENLKAKWEEYTKQAIESPQYSTIDRFCPQS
jgi:hypothetical protein